MTWRDRARCAGADPDLFHPDDPDGPPIEARVLCANCDVQDACLEYALDRESGETAVSFMAGLTARERRAMRRRRRRAEAA